MADDSQVNAVCKELDDLAIRMLGLMEQYINLKMAMEDLVKTGSLHLAKSRYIMGNKSVSVLQLPTEDSELNAFAKILRPEGDEDEVRLELSRMSLNPPSPIKVATDTQINDDGLKRRKGKSNQETKDEEVDSGGSLPKDDKKDEEKPIRKKDVMQDPLKWFGVLVPQNLRLAQSSFNKAVEISVEIANVQLEMESVQQKYDGLIVEKTNLINKSSEGAKTS